MPGNAFGPREKARFVELVQRGRRPRTAAEDVGFTWQTVRNHLRSDPAFAEAFQEAGDLASERVEEVVYDLATEGSLAAAKFWLTNRTRDWVDSTKQVQVTGAGGGPIELAVGSTEMWRNLLQDPEARTEALAFAREVPAIEATGRES